MSAVRSWLSVTLAGATILSFLPGSLRAEQSVFPGRHGTTKAPEQVGMNTVGLQAFSDLVGGRGCVVRHGCLIYTWGDATKRGDVASACKPWFSHFLFKALEDGKLASVDEQVAQRWEPRLKTLNADRGFKDREITWRHFATQTSCYEITDKPGMAYCYNDWQMALFWDLLFLKVYGVTYDTVDQKVLHPLLTDELECEDQPTFLAFGTNNRPGRVGVSPRDFRRFGLLYLHRGNWNGKQLLGWIRTAANFNEDELESGRDILSDFVRTVRRETQAATKRLGHPVQLAVRVPATPEFSQGLGFDAVAWAREGLMDMIIPSDLPVPAKPEPRLELPRMNVCEVAPRLAQFEAPLEAFARGYNVVELAVESGGPQTVIWLEILIDPLATNR